MYKNRPMFSFLLATLCFGFVGCGKKDGTGSNEKVNVLPTGNAPKQSELVEDATLPVGIATEVLSFEDNSVQIPTGNDWEESKRSQSGHLTIRRYNKKLDIRVVLEIQEGEFKTEDPEEWNQFIPRFMDEFVENLKRVYFPTYQRVEIKIGTIGSFPGAYMKGTYTEGKKTYHVEDYSVFAPTRAVLIRAMGPNQGDLPKKIHALVRYMAKSFK